MERMKTEIGELVARERIESLPTFAYSSPMGEAYGSSVIR